MLLTDEVKRAYNLEKEDPKVRESYGEHICGHSVLLARRLSEAGVPIEDVYRAAERASEGAAASASEEGDAS